MRRRVAGAAGSGRYCSGTAGENHGGVHTAVGPNHGGGGGARRGEQREEEERQGGEPMRRNFARWLAT